ncbi:STAS domain-containing protein [Streptomyces sp. NPDC028635]|uniref:STAS domain-containing protein n=1 Tax=Streptomyces sp. NPDC028635 TaxID=3154800 RepID=UPI003411A07E
MDASHAPSAPERGARVVGGTTLVEVRGDLDMLTAPSLAARLDELTAGRRPDVVLDLRGVSFIDCAGLGVLCRARNRVLARWGRLRLVSDDPGFLRILRYARLADVFEIHAGPLVALGAGMSPDATLPHSRSISAGTTGKQREGW